jgi:hypothetical protein
MINAYMVLVKEFERRRAFEREILNLILMVGCEADSCGSEWGTVAGSSKKENIKCMQFLDDRQNIIFSKMTLRHSVSW